MPHRNSISVCRRILQKRDDRKQGAENPPKDKNLKKDWRRRMKYCFGVDIGGTTVKMGLFAENGDIRDKWEIVTKTEDEGKAILPDVAAAISGKMEEHHLTKEDIKGIGVGVPAPVTSEGVVNGSANLGWKYKEAKKELEDRNESHIWK